MSPESGAGQPAEKPQGVFDLKSGLTPIWLDLRTSGSDPNLSSYFPKASFTPKPTSMVPAIRFIQTARRGLARMRSAAKRVMEMTITQ